MFCIYMSVGVGRGGGGGGDAYCCVYLKILWCSTEVISRQFIGDSPTITFTTRDDILANKYL